MMKGTGWPISPAATHNMYATTHPGSSVHGWLRKKDAINIWEMNFIARNVTAKENEGQIIRHWDNSKQKVDKNLTTATRLAAAKESE